MTDDRLTSGLRPTHPGEILREDILPSLGLTKTGFAKRLGVSRQTLYDILGERQPVTANMALRLGKLLGDGPRIWLALQQDYDLRIAERELDDVIAAITPIAAMR